jgi:hypothetical protein
MKTLQELKDSDLPLASIESINLVIDDKTGENGEEVKLTTDSVVEYLSSFTIPTGYCPMCDNNYGGIFGTFTWGIAHGEGFCSACNYPMRANHKIEHLGRISNMILPYHPKELSEPTK